MSISYIKSQTLSIMIQHFQVVYDEHLYDEPWVIYRIIESLYYIPETNMTLYVNYTGIFKKLTKKLQWSRQCGIGERTDIEINKTEQSIRKQTNSIVVNWYMTREHRQFEGERTVFSMNGAGTIDHLYAKKKGI